MTKRRSPPSTLIVPAGQAVTQLPLYCLMCHRTFDVIIRGCVHRVKNRFWIVRAEETVPLGPVRCPECHSTRIYLVARC